MSVTFSLTTKNKILPLTINPTTKLQQRVRLQLHDQHPQDILPIAGRGQCSGYLSEDRLIMITRGSYSRFPANSSINTDNFRQTFVMFDKHSLWSTFVVLIKCPLASYNSQYKYISYSIQLPTCFEGLKGPGADNFCPRCCY